MREIVAGIFEQAKTYWSGAMWAKVIVAAAGFYLAFAPSKAAPIAGIVLILELIAAMGFYLADALKSNAEPMLTRLDYEDGLAWTISKQQKDEYRSDYSKFEERGKKVRGEDRYFTSEVAPGPERLKRNALESALYTRAIAKSARNVVAIVTGLVATAFCTLLGTGLYRHFGKGHPTGTELFVDALIFLVTIDLVPLALNYHALANAATQARQTLASSSTLEQIVPAVMEYQLARATAPLLPTFTFLKGRLPLAAIWTGRFD